MLYAEVHAGMCNLMKLVSLREKNYLFLLEFARSDIVLYVWEEYTWANCDGAVRGKIEWAPVCST